MRLLLALALLLGGSVARADELADAASELGAGRVDVALTVRSSPPAARLIASGIPGKVTLVPVATAASVHQAGFGLWIDADVRVDAQAGTLAIDARLVRVGLSWRERLTTRWVRVVHVRRPLDAAARRALGLAPIGPRTFARPRRLELDLGAPLLALVAVDLDGDGRAELIALTSDEVVLLDGENAALVPRQRVPLTGAAPLPRPREPLGTLVAADLDGDGVPELVARSSEHGDGVRLAWRAGALVVDGAWPDYPMCAVGNEVRSMTLVSGRNRFAAPGVGEVSGASCDAGGRVLAAAPDGTFVGAPLAAGVGAAFALADLDGDGAPELLASAYRAPGDGDQLSVWRLGDPGARASKKRSEPMWKSDALSGGIVAVASGDVDGDGAPDVIFAARLLGATRTDVWIVR